MIPERWRLPLLVVLALVQLGQAALLIVPRLRAADVGRTHRFQTRLVDPYDPFRGRYVQLDFEAREAAISRLDRLPREGDRLHVGLARGAEGFAVLTEASDERPSSGDYLTVTVEDVDAIGGVARVRLPFDRYYMNEVDAPAAEGLYWRRQRGEDPRDYVEVRVEDGTASVVGLFLDGRPIEDWLDDASEDGGRW